MVGNKRFRFCCYIIFEVIMIIMLFSCNTSEGVQYKVLSPQEGWPQGIMRNAVTYKAIQERGDIIYLSFRQGGNKNYSEVSIDIFTIEMYSMIYIKSFEFEYDKKIKTININKTYKLNQERSDFFKEGVADVTAKGYNTLLYFEDNGIKVYFKDFMVKQISDEKMPMRLRVHYSFDRNGEKAIDIDYLVLITNKPSFPTDMKYKIFPGL